MSETLIAIIAILSIIVGTVVFISGALHFVNRPNCKLMGDTMGYESYWSIRTSCMIKVDGKLIPIGSYRVIK